MTSGQFLITGDLLAFSHLQGSGTVDCHGDSASRNLLKFFMKSMRMKFWSLRGSYSSPFGNFQNAVGTYRRCPGAVRISVGAAHSERMHVTWTVGHLVREVLEFSDEQIEFDNLYNESKLF